MDKRIIKKEIKAEFQNKDRLPFADNKIKSVLKGDLMDGRRKVSNERWRVN